MEIVGRGRTADIYDYGEGKILKLFHDDGPLAAREIAIARIVQSTGLPVPSAGEAVLQEGRQGIVYERITGRLLARQLAARPWTVTRLARQMAETHAAIHRHTLPGLPPQKERLHAKIEAAANLEDAQKQAIHTRLDALPGGQMLCHNDFHPENIFVTSQGLVVIDWVDATAGHPLADVARTALILQFAAIPQGNRLFIALVNALRGQFRRAYLARYFALSGATPEQLRQWMLPVAAGRLSEAILEERQPLLDLVASLL
ncbi:MAG: aminoglycoside phosphotransferase family protein [Anaerolineae bacterium]|nr:aminoglycoside phosphotransferase family protein [Anaerolineae bacterium]